MNVVSIDKFGKCLYSVTNLPSSAKYCFFGVELLKSFGKNHLHYSSYCCTLVTSITIYTLHVAVLIAPQIRRSLLNEDEYGFRKAKRPIYYDEGLEVIMLRFLDSTLLLEYA